MGVEMFHIDAGWFRGVGDWYPNPKKFPHGLAFIADEAHKSGLRFGIWVDWTQAALDTEPGALNVHDPKVREPAWWPMWGRTGNLRSSRVRRWTWVFPPRMIIFAAAVHGEHVGPADDPGQVAVRRPPPAGASTLRRYMILAAMLDRVLGQQGVRRETSSVPPP